MEIACSLGMVKVVIDSMFELQGMLLSEVPPDEEAVQRLRSEVPQQIIGHFDRLISRGKKGVALVRNGACTGCHMRLPIGSVMELRRGDDIQICGTCGRYLKIEEEAVVEAAPEKPKRGRRKTKAAAA